MRTTRRKTPWEQTPPGADPLEADTPREQIPPGADTPQEQTPQEQTPPPGGSTPTVNRITDASENITLPQLRCGR